MAERIITGIEPVKRKKGWFELAIKDCPSFYIDEETYYKNGLSVGGVISDSKLRRIKENADFAWLKSRSLQIISRRMITERDLKRKLSAERKSLSIRGEVISWLKQYGFIDDLKYAGALIRSQISRGGKSRLYLKKKLLERGVSMENAEKALSIELIEYDETEAVIKLAQKKYMSLRDLPPIKARQKLVNYLKGKGFNWEAISKALSNVIDDGAGE